MLLMFTTLIFVVSIAEAGRLHPQVQKELDELQLVFGDLGISNQDLTALATELATKADDADAEALLYRDFKRRLTDKKLRAKFDEKLQQLHVYNEFVERLVEAIGDENIVEDSTYKTTLNSELQALEEHIRKISEDVKRGNRNKLFIRLSNLLSEFEKNNSRLSTESSDSLSSSTSSSPKEVQKTNMEDSDEQIMMNTEENIDRLSHKTAPITRDQQGQWIVNGKIWPKDSLHHIPKWLQIEYEKSSKMGQESSNEEENITTKTSPNNEDEYMKNREMNDKASRFHFYQQQFATSSEEENMHSMEEENEGFLQLSSTNAKSNDLKMTMQEEIKERNMSKEDEQAHETDEERQDENVEVTFVDERRTTKKAPMTDLSTADNNTSSIDEELDSSGEEMLSTKQLGKLMLNETTDKIGGDEASSQQPITSAEQETPDSESSELIEDNLPIELASEMSLNQQFENDSEDVSWEQTRTTLLTQETLEDDRKQSWSSSTTSDNIALDSNLPENPTTEGMKLFNKFPENSTASSRSAIMETTLEITMPPTTVGDEKYNSQEAENRTGSQQIPSSSGTRSLDFAEMNEANSIIQNETTINQVIQSATTSSTSIDASLVSISHSTLSQQSKLFNESSDTTGNIVIHREEAESKTQQTMPIAEESVNEAYTLAQSTKSNGIEDDGIEDISAPDAITMTTEPIRAVEILETTITTSKIPLIEVRTTMQTIEGKVENSNNDNLSSKSSIESNDENLMIKNLNRTIKTEEHNELTNRNENIELSIENQNKNQLGIALSIIEEKILHKSLSDEELRLIERIFNRTSTTNEMNLGEDEKLFEENNKRMNKTQLIVDEINTLMMSESNNDEGSGEMEII